MGKWTDFSLLDRTVGKHWCEFWDIVTGLVHQSKNFTFSDCLQYQFFIVVSDAMKHRRWWFEYKNILSKCALMDLNGPCWRWRQVYGINSFEELENGMYEIQILLVKRLVISPVWQSGEKHRAHCPTNRSNATACSWAVWGLCGVVSTELNTARWKELQSEKEELERRFQEEGQQLRRQQQQEMQALEQRLQQEYQAKKESLQEQHRLQLEQAKLQHQDQVSLHLLPLKSSPF